MTTLKVTEIPHTVGAGMRRMMITAEKVIILAAVTARLMARPMVAILMGMRAVILG